MGRTEELFAAGVAAFRTGEPRNEDQEFDWKCGWDSALAAKRVAFMDYVKTMDLQKLDLHARRGPQWQVEQVREARGRKIDRLNARYPDFPEAYQKLRARQ